MWLIGEKEHHVGAYILSHCFDVRYLLIWQMFYSQ